MTNTITCTYDAPFGTLYLTAEGGHLTSISHKSDETTSSSPLPDVLKQTKEQLDDYFNGKLQSFDIPIKFKSGTEFQQQVWHALMAIKSGTTATYKDIAKTIGNEKAVRAVGGANNKNPISIIIPCHRVIGSTGQLVGYAGGLDRKEWLLNHEQRLKHKQG